MMPYHQTDWPHNKEMELPKRGAMVPRHLAAIVSGAALRSSFPSRSAAEDIRTYLTIAGAAL